MKYWTVAEAQEYLPRLRALVETIRQAALQQAGTLPSLDGQRSPMIDAQQAFDELSDGDIILRDPATGLVDFHARGADGVTYFLCWRRGEAELSWWHLPEEGIAGRKPLPRDTGPSGEA